MPFVLALGSSVIYGTADFLGGMGSRRAPAVTVGVLSQAAGLLVLLAMAPFVTGHTRGPDLAWAVGAGLSGSAGVVLLYHALATGVVSTAAPLISMVALAVPVVVGILSGERPALLQLLGIVAGVVAVALISAGKGVSEAGSESARAESLSSGTVGVRSGQDTPRSLAPAFASGLLIGSFLVCLGRIAPGASMWPLVTARGAGTLGLCVVMLARRTSFRPPAAAVGWIAGAGATDVIANLLYVLATQRAPLSLVATIVSLAPAVTVALAQVVLRERLDAAQRAGVALALLSVVLLAQGR